MAEDTDKRLADGRTGWHADEVSFQCLLEILGRNRDVLVPPRTDADI
jgi:hypothetical protein